MEKNVHHLLVGVPSDTDSHLDPVVVKQTLIAAYNFNLAKNLKAEVQEIDCHPQDRFSDKQFAQWTTTWWQQFSVLLRRGVKERKYESFSGIQVGEVLVMAIYSGLLWLKTDASHIQDKVTNFHSTRMCN